MSFVDSLLPPRPLDVTALGNDLARLNDHLRETGDPARLRYAAADFEGEPAWFVSLQLTLEIPPCDEPDEPSSWVWETYERYRQLFDDYFSHHRGVLATPLLRTAEELADPSAGLGVAVPEFVESD